MTEVTAATDFGEMDATAQAALVRSGVVSPSDLVEDAIRRLEQVNGRLNAVIFDMFEQARTAARNPPGDGRFAGVPFLMKDFVAEVVGVPFTEGSEFLKGYRPEQDSALYRRYCQAGLITIGKTNLPEFAIGATTEPQVNGPAHNPWDLARTTGGSSGGAAAAVAARVVPMAHANDVAGSIRIPAACCGLVGLKPTRGRTSLAPHYGDLFSGLFVEHAVTRSVRDSAALLDATAIAELGEPYRAPPLAGPLVDEVGHPPGPLRIGFSTRTPLDDPLDPACAEAVRETAELCESLGHVVDEAAPAFDGMVLWQNFTTLLAGGLAWAIADWERRLDKTAGEADFEPFVWAFTQRGRAVGAADYLLALQDVQGQVRRMARFWTDHDLWLTPTLGQPPVPLGTLVYRDDPIALRRRMAQFSPYTYLANASGQPAISLPLAESETGLPIGLHFTARQGEEAVLIRLAAQLEQARPWAGRKPPVAAT